MATIEKKHRVINHTEKNIKEFKSSDTIYVRKMKNGFILELLCKFVKFEKGIVTAKVISVQQTQNDYYKNDIVTSRLKNCYLWAGDTDMVNNIYGCMCFNKEGFAKK